MHAVQFKPEVTGIELRSYQVYVHETILRINNTMYNKQTFLE